MRAWLAPLVAGLVLCAPLARAEEPCPAGADDVKLANEGKELRKAGNNAAAYEKFRCAYRTIKSYTMSANLGIVELALDKYAAAANHLSRAVREWPLDDARMQQAREEVQRRLDLAKQHVLGIAVEANRDGASVAIDGAAAGLSPLSGPVYVDPGEHTVTGRIEGLATATAKVRGDAGATVKVRLRIGEASQPAAASSTGSSHGSSPAPGQASGVSAASARPEQAPAPAAEPTPERAEGSKRHTAVMAALLSTGAAGAIFGAVAIGLSRAAAGRASDGQAAIESQSRSGTSACLQPSPALSGACNDLASEVAAKHGWQNAAIGGFAAGGALLLAGGIYAAVAPASARSARIVPMLGPRTAGVGLTASF